MIGLKHKDVGYFTSAGQIEPVHDPGPGTLCPICGDLLGQDNVRTYSLMPLGEGAPVLSVFYRVHITCANAAGEKQIEALDEQALAIAGTILS